MSRTAEPLDLRRGLLYPIKKMSTNHTDGLGRIPEALCVMNTTGERIGWIGGMVEFIQEDEDGTGIAEGLGGKFNLSLKTGFGSGEIIGLETDTERLEGCGGQVTDGTAVGMCQEGGEGKGSQHGGFTALVRAGEKRMALVRTEFYGEGLSLMDGDMKVGRTVEMKDGLGGGDPLDRMNLGMMIEFYMDFQGTDILQSEAEVHGVENGLTNGMFVGEKGWKRTAMDGETMGSETGFQDLVSGSELH